MRKCFLRLFFAKSLCSTFILNRRVYPPRPGSNTMKPFLPHNDCLGMITLQNGTRNRGRCDLNQLTRMRRNKYAQMWNTMMLICDSTSSLFAIKLTLPKLWLELTGMNLDKFSQMSITMMLICDSTSSLFAIKHLW